MKLHDIIILTYAAETWQVLRAAANQAKEYAERHFDIDDFDGWDKGQRLYWILSARYSRLFTPEYGTEGIAQALNFAADYNPFHVNG